MLSTTFLRGPQLGSYPTTAPAIPCKGGTTCLCSLVDFNWSTGVAQAAPISFPDPTRWRPGEGFSSIETKLWLDAQGKFKHWAASCPNGIMMPSVGGYLPIRSAKDVLSLAERVRTGQAPYAFFKNSHPDHGGRWGLFYDARTKVKAALPVPEKKSFLEDIWDYSPVGFLVHAVEYVGGKAVNIAKKIPAALENAICTLVSIPGSQIAIDAAGAYAGGAQGAMTADKATKIAKGLCAAAGGGATWPPGTFARYNTSRKVYVIYTPLGS